VKNTIRIIAGCLIGLTATLVSPFHVQAEEYSYSVGQGFEFNSGKYGTNTRTEAIYAPFTIIAIPTERLGLSLEIPLVYQNNSNVNASIAHGSMQGSKAAMLPVVGMGGISGTANGMSGSGMGMSSSTNSTNQSESGLGDITLKAGYILLPEKDVLPQIRSTAFIKFPTADKNKSLGTGEFDEGLSVELSKWLGNWNPFTEGGYTVQGTSDKFSLRNYMTYNAGVGYQLSERFRPIVLIKGATPLTDGTGSLLEVRLKLKYQATNHTGIDGYIAKGVTTNSPDYGTGFAVYFDF
jgi:hypothetical protein